jgi:hypothetical protein
MEIQRTIQRGRDKGLKNEKILTVTDGVGDFRKRSTVD